MTYALNEAEQLALVALVRFTIRLDGRTSLDEVNVIRDVLRDALRPQPADAAPVQAPRR